MNYIDITVGIVTFKSENVLFSCLKSIKNIRNIIIFDNSNDLNTKKKVNKIYPNIKFILSRKNLGYGEANNKIIKLCKTKYLFVLNPDTVLKKNCELELLKSINSIKSDFSIIAPLSKEKNFGFFNDIKPQFRDRLFQVDYVKGFAMLMDIKKIKKIGLFDKNFFLYLEEIDLCKRLIMNNQKIFISKYAKIIHLAAKSSNILFEFDKCRNWHWMLSKFYFKKKHHGYPKAFLESLPILITSIIKFIYYFITNNEFKKKIYIMRFSGLLNSILRKKSWYRPQV
jgi:GT2 family glycosyltransferase